MTLKDRDKKYIWHPFDQMKGSDILPISRGEGAYVYDEENNRYIDGFSSWWVNGHGHSNPYIAQKFGENARLSTTKNFNSEIVLSQTMSLYEKL